MTVAITPVFVKEIISTKLLDSEVEAAISTAMVLYRNFLEKRSLSSDLQIEITRYLAAHYVSLRDQYSSISEEKIGDASIKYGGPLASTNKEASGLSSTGWGQAAIDLDPTGTLKRLGLIPPRMVSL